MPIPSFDYNNVLPPHLGNPTNSNHLSPYPCTILELCHQFSTSKERILILKNFVTFRQRMTAEGIINGFQWLDGSWSACQGQARYAFGNPLLQRAVHYPHLEYV